MRSATKPVYQAVTSCCRLSVRSSSTPTSRRRSCRCAAKLRGGRAKHQEPHESRNLGPIDRAFRDGDTAVIVLADIQKVISKMDGATNYYDNAAKVGWHPARFPYSGAACRANDGFPTATLRPKLTSVPSASTARMPPSMKSAGTLTRSTTAPPTSEPMAMAI